LAEHVRDSKNTMLNEERATATYPPQGSELSSSYLVPTTALASSQPLQRVVLVGLIASAVGLGVFLFEAVTQYTM
jgi:hypothetical protein